MTSNKQATPLLSIQSSLIRHLLSCLAKSGYQPEALVNTVGHAVEQRLAEGRRIPSSEVESLLELFLDKTNDPLFGFHLGQQVRPEGFGVVGYIRQACQNLNDFILICIRYEHLISSIGKTRLVREPGSCVWSWSVITDNKRFERHATEFMITAMHSTHQLLQSHLTAWLLEVRFSHSAPDTDAHQALEEHFGCPVRFDQAASGLVIRNDAIMQPFSSADAALLFALERHAQREESSHVLDSFYCHAYQVLRNLVLIGQGTKANLANSLGISLRHLHRQLEKEQTNFRSLHEQVRLALAIDQLRTPTLTVTAIAKNLGYSESQSFIRWFKKQTGKTPSRYRLNVPD